MAYKNFAGLVRIKGNNWAAYQNAIQEKASNGKLVFAEISGDTTESHNGQYIFANGIEYKINDPAVFQDLIDRVTALETAVDKNNWKIGDTTYGTVSEYLAAYIKKNAVTSILPTSTGSALVNVYASTPTAEGVVTLTVDESSLEAEMENLQKKVNNISVNGVEGQVNIATHIASVTVDGSVVDLSNSYKKAETGAAVVAGDSIDVAIGKLEKQIDSAVAGGVNTIVAGNGIDVDATNVNNPKVSAKVKTGEKVLEATTNGLQTTLNLTYDEANKKIKLTGIDSAEIASIDASDFVKDGVLYGAQVIKATGTTQTVTIKDQTHEFTGLTKGKNYIVFCWKTQEYGTSTVEYSWDKIEADALVNDYTGSNTIDVSTDRIISVKIDSDANTIKAGIKGISVKFSNAASHGVSINTLTEEGGLQTVVTPGSVASGNDSVVTGGAVYDAVNQKVDKTTTIAGVDLQDNITKAEMLEALGVEDGAQVNVIEKVLGETGVTDTKYVSVAVGEVDDNKHQTITSAVKVQEVSEAGENAKGLAEASDVKAYVDAKNVSAEGDTYVNATAANNKVTVAASETTKASLALADSALQTVSATGDTWVTASFATKADNAQALTVAANVQTGATSVTDDKLAAKSYVDEQVAAVTHKATIVNSTEITDTTTANSNFIKVKDNYNTSDNQHTYNVDAVTVKSTDTTTFANNGLATDGYVQECLAWEVID